MTQHLTELDVRSDSERTVMLLWRRRDNRLFVTVEEKLTGEAFQVRVRDHDSPLDVFQHPYAYAAWQGIETQAAAPPLAA
jgi:hypothetical protein